MKNDDADEPARRETRYAFRLQEAREPRYKYRNFGKVCLPLILYLSKKQTELSSQETAMRRKGRRDDRCQVRDGRDGKAVNR